MVPNPTRLVRTYQHPRQTLVLLATAIALVAPVEISKLVPALAQSDQLIQASRPSADTAGVKAALAPVLKSIPERIKDLVFGAGCRIMVVPTVAEYMQMTYSDKPRGYRDGGGYDNADGLFVPAKNQLLVSERVSYRNSAPSTVARVPYVVRHEFGHAFDQYLGKKYKSNWAASSVPKFVDTHHNEVERLTNTQRDNLAYFCQEGSAGASEVFAEFFCMHCTPQSEWGDREKTLLTAFPRTNALVQEAIRLPVSVADWD